MSLERFSQAISTWEVLSEVRGNCQIKHACRCPRHCGGFTGFAAAADPSWCSVKRLRGLETLLCVLGRFDLSYTKHPKIGGPRLGGSGRLNLWYFTCLGGYERPIFTYFTCPGGSGEGHISTILRARVGALALYPGDSEGSMYGGSKYFTCPGGSGEGHIPTSPVSYTHLTLPTKRIV